MTELRLKDPFREIAEKDLPPLIRHERLIARYLREKKKAMLLYGNYSIKKLNWLQRKLFESQKLIDGTHNKQVV